MVAIRRTRFAWMGALTALSLSVQLHAAETSATVDFGREIKPILSNNCFKCHGPDAGQRKGGTKDHRLRLDTEEGAFATYGDRVPIVPGKLDQGELLARIASSEPDEVMPPAKSAKPLSATDIALIKKWIAQGAKYTKQWSYVKPVRPELPQVKDGAWPRNPIDAFILRRLEGEGLAPEPEADRYTLIRRVSLDLTGLPPTVPEVDQFVADSSPDAYDRLVDRLLASRAYGEHWARMWLDLARYADSSGYASDTPRTIWAYRDYVINAFNENKPFDQFTIEQLAGDLLPNPSQEQLTATAFHRNTMTNTEGGTTREEFRNAAIIDRVNTTMSVWMGTSMACAQCHDHKYDPLPQKDYFRLFAILNNTEDADRSDDEPTLKFFTLEQEAKKSSLRAQIELLKKALRTPTPELIAGEKKWEEAFPVDLQWHSLKAASARSKLGATMSVRDDGSVVAGDLRKSDTYTVELPVEQKQLTGVRIEALPAEEATTGDTTGGNFVISHVGAEIVPDAGVRPVGRFVRVELPGEQVYLALSEVQVFSGTDNIAPHGKASQISTGFGGDASRAIDGNTDGDYYKSQSTSHTEAADDPWWEVDLGESRPIDRVVIWNRTDGFGERLKNARVIVLDDRRQVAWSTQLDGPPNPSASLPTGGARPVSFEVALADSGEEAARLQAVIREAGSKKPADAAQTQGAEPGWLVSASDKRPHGLSLLARKPMDVPAGSKLVVTIEQASGNDASPLTHFRVSATQDARVDQLVATPADVVAALTLAADSRSDQQRETISRYYLQSVAPELKPTRESLASLSAELDGMKPASVPIMRELTGNNRRHTFIEHRGNYLSLGEEVQPGVPEAFGPAGEVTDRLALARWLVSPDNPLTARVIANRYWEQIFGIGIVRTSEEFGSQGELPSHPRLLDWLATELVANNWDTKRFVKLLVTSAAYRQSSKVTPELLERDPDNRLLARGPRFRMSAEMVRDQALSASGLLSSKMFGPSVRPFRPAAGLSAAFGGGLDWNTSDGQDKYRRGLYTEARRTSPYPSMATFDLPSREICTLRRPRTNTPLQALVTLNDPVYVEAAQALARRMIAAGTEPRDRLQFGFRACVARPTRDEEMDRLLSLYAEAKASLANDPKKATDLATIPLGPLPPGTGAVDAAAWTAVANVLLNLDETLMKR